MNHVELSVHAVMEDRVEDALYQRQVTTSVDDHETRVKIVVPGDLVPPVTIVTAEPAVARHELRQYVAIKNQDAQLRSLPEARRRREERKERRRQRKATAEQCSECNNSRWISDHEGNSRPCPVCAG